MEISDYYFHPSILHSTLCTTHSNFSPMLVESSKLKTNFQQFLKTYFYYPK